MSLKLFDVRIDLLHNVILVFSHLTLFQAKLHRNIYLPIYARYYMYQIIIV